jgi:hypothetical protein
MEPNIVQYKCEQCGKAFSKANGLRMHIQRTHLGLGPQKGKEFAPLKRKHSKRRVVTAPVREICYCPGCGLNLRALATAMTVTSTMQ